MVKVRQDAWSHEDDLLLAETVLRHIREGSTQLKAFDEVGDQLNRTSAACGFRWNAEVRNRYLQAIDIAKRQRKEKKRAMAGKQQTPQAPMTANASMEQEFRELPVFQSQTETKREAQHLDQSLVHEPTQEEPQEEEVYQEQNVHQETEPISFEQVIKYMRDLKQQYHASNQSKSKLSQLEQENHVLRERNEKLEKQVQQMDQKYNMIQEDYQALMQIMDRARKMIVFDDEDQANAPNAFRMEKNGNLERVAREA